MPRRAPSTSTSSPRASPPSPRPSGPSRVIVRLSDFKSNEYRKLIGGTRYEPDEENPMLGFRGASRYISGDFKDAFAMECEALKRARSDMGLTNIEIMVPFVRTVKQAERVAQMLAERGLKRGVERAAPDHDVRGAQQRHPGRAVPGALRRHVDRLQRPDAAHAGPGPRLRAGAAGERLRRARPGRQGADLARHRRLPRHRQVRRHLRPGAQRPPRLRRLAGGRGHRLDLAQPGHAWSRPGRGWPRASRCSRPGFPGVARRSRPAARRG